VVSALTTNIGAIIAGLILTPFIGAIINALAIKHSRMFSVGDVIEDRNSGQRGIVSDISMIHTRFTTLDHGSFSIPNYKIRSRDTINYTKENRVRRVTLDVLITYDSDVGDAQTLIEELLINCNDILTKEEAEDMGLDLPLDENDSAEVITIGPAGTQVRFNPDCRIAAFADSGILLRAYYWMNSTHRHTGHTEPLSSVTAYSNPQLLHDSISKSIER